MTDDVTAEILIRHPSDPRVDPLVIPVSDDAYDLEELAALIEDALAGESIQHDLPLVPDMAGEY